MTAMKTKFQFPLLDLPAELVTLVFEQLDDHKALNNICQACKRTQELAEPILYRGALMRSGYAIENYLASLEKSARRLNAVHHLELAFDSDYAQSWPSVSELLCRTKNLRRLFIESPQCNGGQFENEDEWEEMAVDLLRPFAASSAGSRPLDKLEELTIHINGPESPYWDLGARGLNVFMLPSLRYLRLSCVNILDDTELLVNELPAHRNTPLKTLELEECNITHKGLHAILSLPTALETLQLGENCHNIKHFAEAVQSDANHLIQRFPQATFRALKQHSASLKTLNVVTTDRYYQWAPFRQPRVTDGSAYYGAFADFHALESVSLTGNCGAFEWALMSSRSPPSLREITYKSAKIPRIGSQEDDQQSIATIPFLRAPSCSLPQSLKSLVLVYTNSAMLDEGLMRSGKDFVKAAAKAMEKLGVHLTIKRTESNSYFPPYLWNEPVPQERTIFDGDFDPEYTNALRRATNLRLWSFVED